MSGPSIPYDSSAKNISVNLDPILQAPNQVRRIRLDWHQLRDRLPVFGDDDALGTYVVQEGEALFSEPRDADCLPLHFFRIAPAAAILAVLNVPASAIVAA